MLMTKAIITIAASASLLGTNPAQNTQHVLNNPGSQEKVYVVQGANLNDSEINSILENYLKSMDKTLAQYPVSQITVKTVPVQSQQAVQKHISAVPAQALQAVQKHVTTAPAQSQQAVQKPVAAAPAQAQQAVQKPVAAAPTQAQQAVQKPVAAVPAQAQQAMQKPVAAAPAQSQQAVQKPVAAAPAQAQQAVQKPVAAAPAQATQTAGTLSAFEQQVVDLTNQERAKYGLPALKVDPTLSRMAHAKSLDMSEHNYFSHTSPTYGSPFDMMKEFGISYNSAGENIAMGQKTPQEVVTAWMNSPGHRQNILDSSYNYIGTGYVAQGDYWSQDFISK